MTKLLFLLGFLATSCGTNQDVLSVWHFLMPSMMSAIANAEIDHQDCYETGELILANGQDLRIAYCGGYDETINVLNKMLEIYRQSALDPARTIQDIVDSLGGATL
jgi:hypothetical protein